MATGRSTKLTGAVGEFLVSAELCRRDLIATPFAGNVPHYDIIASGQFGGHVAIQVKAINGGTWQFDIRSFLDVQMEDDGKHQRVGKLQPEPFPRLVYVLVVLKGTAQDEFFILGWKDLQDILVKGYKAYLRRHSYIRPRAPGSFHTALAILDVEPFKDLWGKIQDRVSNLPPS